MTQFERNSVFAAMGSTFVIFLLVATSSISPLGLLIFGLLLIASLRAFIAATNEVLDNKPMGNQRDVYIAAMSILFFISNIVKYGVTSDNALWKATGWLVSLLGGVLSSLKDLLPMLWPNKE